MPEYDNRDRGALFKNDKTGGNPNWPDYRGSINVGGVDYWLSAWIKESKKGEKFMSLSVKPKQAKEHEPSRNEYAKASQAATRAQAPLEDIDDSIPL